MYSDTHLTMWTGDPASHLRHFMQKKKEAPLSATP